MNVIDFRYRVPTPEFAASAAGAHHALWWNTRPTRLWREEFEPEPYAHPATTTIDECVAWMRANNVRGVLPGRGMPGVAIPNDHLHDLCVRYPDCFVALVGIDASQRRDAMHEIETNLARGFAGVHFETGWLRPTLVPDSAVLYPLYALCEDRNAIAVIHVGPLGGPERANNDPFTVAHVARDFPSLRIVMAHGGYPFADDAIRVALTHPNVWLAPDPYHDFPGGERYREWANRSDVIADRLLYGSSHGWPTAPGALERFAQLGWRDDVLVRVMHDNAAALLAR